MKSKTLRADRSGTESAPRGEEVNRIAIPLGREVCVKRTLYFGKKQIICRIALPPNDYGKLMLTQYCTVIVEPDLLNQAPGRKFLLRRRGSAWKSFRAF